MNRVAKVEKESEFFWTGALGHCEEGKEIHMQLKIKRCDGRERSPAGAGRSDGASGRQLSSDAGTAPPRL